MCSHLPRSEQENSRACRGEQSRAEQRRAEQSRAAGVIVDTCLFPPLLTLIDSHKNTYEQKQDYIDTIIDN